MTEAMSINLIDAEEYPSMATIEQRWFANPKSRLSDSHSVKIIGNLFHAPPESLGVSTIGSSEAIILAVLAAKRLWRDKRKAAGKPYDKYALGHSAQAELYRPNLVMSSAVQVVRRRKSSELIPQCWEKSVNYTEERLQLLVIEADGAGRAALRVHVGDALLHRPADRCRCLRREHDHGLRDPGRDVCVAGQRTAVLTTAQTRAPTRTSRRSTICSRSRTATRAWTSTSTSTRRAEAVRDSTFIAHLIAQSSRPSATRLSSGTSSCRYAALGPRPLTRQLVCSINASGHKSVCSRAAPLSLQVRARVRRRGLASLPGPHVPARQPRCVVEPTMRLTRQSSR